MTETTDTVYEDDTATDTATDRTADAKAEDVPPDPDVHVGSGIVVPSEDLTAEDREVATFVEHPPAPGTRASERALAREAGDLE